MYTGSIGSRQGETKVIMPSKNAIKYCILYSFPHFTILYRFRYQNLQSEILISQSFLLWLFSPIVNGFPLFYNTYSQQKTTKPTAAKSLRSSSALFISKKNPCAKAAPHFLQILPQNHHTVRRHRKRISLQRNLASIRRQISCNLRISVLLRRQHYLFCIRL